MKLLGIHIGYWVLALFIALVVAGASIYRANTIRYPSTAQQALTGCRAHGGVRAITDPGSNGAYVVCLDGKQAFHTKTGRHAR